MTDSSLSLTETFPSASEADWLALVEKGLRGGAMADLMGETRDGLSRGPLSTANHCPDDMGSFTRIDDMVLGDRTWHIAAPVTDPDVAYANTQALEDLTGGASALRIVAGENGVALRTRGDIQRLFDQVHTDLIQTSFAPHTSVDLSLIHI